MDHIFNFDEVSINYKRKLQRIYFQMQKPKKQKKPDKNSRIQGCKI